MKRLIWWRVFWAVFAACLTIVVGIALAEYRETSPTKKHHYPARYDLAPGVTTVPFTLDVPLFSEPPTEPTMPHDEAVQFLDSDFTIVRDVWSLPPVIFRSITKSGGLLAIGPRDADIPLGCVITHEQYMARLLFAGITGDRGFLYFQVAGGLVVLPPHLVLFRFDTMHVTPLWRGWGDCLHDRAGAKDLRQLRDYIGTLPP